MSVGLLVYGTNHFIVRGPRPNVTTARALAHHWSVILIGQTTPQELRPWRISTKEYRENLEWCFVVEAGGPSHSAAVVQLMAEMQQRGIQAERI